MPDATNKPTAKETADFLRSLSMPEFDAVMKLASVRRANGLPFPTPADCREYLDRKFIESSKQMAGNEFDDLISAVESTDVKAFIGSVRDQIEN